jgi:hypothetical protein
MGGGVAKKTDQSKKSGREEIPSVVPGGDWRKGVVQAMMLRLGGQSDP